MATTTAATTSTTNIPNCYGSMQMDSQTVDDHNNNNNNNNNNDHIVDSKTSGNSSKNKMDLPKRSRRKSRLTDSVQEFEETELYRLINLHTEKDYLTAMSCMKSMNSSGMRNKSKKTGNGYLHEMILSLTNVDCHKTKVAESDDSIDNGDVGTDDNNKNSIFRLGLIMIYRLTLYGCDINLQNDLGNTVLHLACFRPYGGQLALHLLRLGCDPCLENKQGYRIFVDNSSFECYLVKGQSNSYCSIWQAVQKEDFKLIRRFMESWFRVNSRRKRKSMLDVAYDTSNYAVVEFLNRYNNTNEFVVACYACDSDKVVEFLQMRYDKPNFLTKDHSGYIPKPLISAIKELLPYSEEILIMLKDLKINDDKEYEELCTHKAEEFHKSEFYKCINELTQQSLEQAWILIDQNKMPLSAVSSRGDGYLHYLIRKYCKCDDLKIKRILIRLIHKLALEGINVNHRNNKGETALITAFCLNADRPFMDYLINLGIDSSYRCRKGQCIAVNAYATRGQLMLTDQTRRQYLPGLWTAVEDNDVARVRFYLNSLCRVNSVKAGRNLLQYALDCNFEEVAEWLTHYFYLTEFAVAALAADVERMKYCLAMGQGASKVNAVYSHYFAGLTEDWKVEFVSRPILISIMEMCPASVVQKFIDYGVNLNVQYEELAPCAPIAFWAFRDDIDEEISIVVAQFADLSMRDEDGSTLLHKAVMRKGCLDKKKLLLSILLERHANVAARDLERRTPRDCCALDNIDHANTLKQMIDDHVLTMVYEENYDGIEELILQGYDHVVDIRGTIRNKTAEELARLRYSKELIELLQCVDTYQSEIKLLHAAVVRNNSRFYTRYLSEKKVAWGVDSRHRNILHLAVLYRHADLVALICDQYPQLINQPDVLLRSPVHYAVSLRDQRQILSIISTSNSVNLQIKEANNMTALDYTEEVENPTPIKHKSRGRRVKNYCVRDIVNVEKEEAEREITSLPENVIQEISSVKEKENTFMTTLNERAHTVP